MRDAKILRFEVIDLRFPTSDTLDGSDAMHPDPDYSAAYVRIVTDDPTLEGRGFTFTIGRGTDLCVAAIHLLEPLVIGRTLSSIKADMRSFWRRLTSDSQLRWVGPEKGVVHLATAAVVNGVWDVLAKASDLPLWKYLASMTSEELVASIDFRYITDALTEQEALELLRAQESQKPARMEAIAARGYPAYTTSCGWLGYSDEKIRRLCREAIADGFHHFKVKVGADLQDDIRRVGIVREEIGSTRKLMIDANQRWDVAEAIAWTKALARFDLWWIEEPTSPDDVLGHAAIARAVAPIGVATGEQCQNRVMFKQLLQANAIEFCQIDACRLGGVNEVLAVLLMARKFGVRVCPHAGGVGLCELVNHLVHFEYCAITGSDEGRVCEFVDHLHEHFEDPCIVRGGRYQTPMRAGYASDIKAASLRAFAFPDGSEWQARRAQKAALSGAIA
ncbi:MAG: L-fuconate dehydratase [Phycisphaerales bacterium]|nr:L-fuconate dehydratase [Phycisphaerales bacterium]